MQTIQNEAQVHAALISKVLRIIDDLTKRVAALEAAKQTPVKQTAVSATTTDIKTNAPIDKAHSTASDDEYDFISK